MSTWEARVSRGTAPAERVDAELRYAVAAPLIRDARLWVDLGCGAGIAQGGAWGDDVPRVRAILVDRDASALAEAQHECRVEHVESVEADLETEAGAQAVRAAVERAAADGDVVVTCFGVLHQLTGFSVTVELLLGLADAGATVILGVPDDAAGGLEDPHRRSAWSAGAVEELRRLVPDSAISLRQVPLRASAIVVDGSAASEIAVPPIVTGQDAVAVHHLLAFGPRAGDVAGAGRVRVADADAERADARRRESDLAYLEARVAQLEAAGT